MKIKEITFEMGNDFAAVMECEHCKRTEKLSSGYHDNYYHTKVIPAMTCKSCGKNRDGITPKQPICPCHPKQDKLMACDDYRCGWKGKVSDVLKANDPFNPGSDLIACPQCRQQTLRTCCDEPGCWNEDTIGTPTDKGYRRTCHKHVPQILSTKVVR